MDKETAISVWTTLERATYEWEHFDASDEEWVDENTPPVLNLPIYDVSLHAGVAFNTNEREFRLFVEVHRSAPSNLTPDYAVTVAEVAKEMDIVFRLKGDGIELG